MQAALDFQNMTVQVLPSPLIANSTLASEVEVGIFWLARSQKLSF
jgi:hypothetical protein